MISAVVHTYNEAKNIERCLSSLAWVDEIIVIDMGSTDDTCRIASTFKVKLYDHPYTGFVEPARNFGIKKATSPWILIVDADEEIPKTLANFLEAEVNKPKADFYRVPRKNIIFGKWIRHSWWPDYKIRLFKKGSVTWVEKIHGVPMTYGSGFDIDAKEELSIIHYNYYSIEQYLERLNRYTTITAKELFLEDRRFKLTDLIEMPSREFVTRFFVWEGYKDGLHGMALALLQSFSELITYLKLWELESFKEDKVSLDKAEKLLTEERKHKQYWLYNTFLNQPHNLLNDLLWRLKRKLAQHG